MFRCRQFFSNRPNGLRKIVLLDRGIAQPLTCVATLANGLRCLIESLFQCVASVDRTLRYLKKRSLKFRQQRLETLKQRVVQVAGKCACARLFALPCAC